MKGKYGRSSGVQKRISEEEPFSTSTEKRVTACDRGEGKMGTALICKMRNLKTDSFRGGKD